MGAKTTSKITENDFQQMSRHVRRLARIADKQGGLEKPNGTTLLCACGYEGEPLALLDTSTTPGNGDRKLPICKGCGDM